MWLPRVIFPKNDVMFKKKTYFFFIHGFYMKMTFHTKKVHSLVYKMETIYYGFEKKNDVSFTGVLIH